jgi:hypothetical protein
MALEVGRFEILFFYWLANPAKMLRGLHCTLNLRKSFLPISQQNQP